MKAHMKKGVAMLAIAGALVGGTSAYAATTGSATTTTPSTATATAPDTGTTTPAPSTTTTPSTTAPSGTHAKGDCPGM
jgi:hypothetical protein